MPSTEILPVLDDLATVIGGTTPEQDTLPTPCEGLDVAGLRRHLLGGITYFDVVFADPAGEQRPNPRDYQGPLEPGFARESTRKLAATLEKALAGGGDTPVNVVELPVSADAPAMERLLAFVGRSATWRPTT